jgi:IS30 family transposase
MTIDIGKDFVVYMTMSDGLNVNTYFNPPFTSWDKGIVQNRFG